jgi:hypothetical protein
MGWDVAIWGSLDLPPGKVDAWLGTVVDGRRWKGWKLWFANEIPGGSRTVAQHLAEWKKLDGQGRHAVDVTIEGPRVEVSGLVPQEAFVERAQAYVSVFRAAEAVGAKGTVMFVGADTPIAYRLTLAGPGKKSRFEELDEDAGPNPEVIRIVESMAARIAKKAAAKPAAKAKKAAGGTATKEKPAAKAKSAAAPKKGTAAPKKGAAPPATSLPAEARAALDDVQARLAKASDAALMKAAAATELPLLHKGQLVPLAEAFPTAAALREGLRGGPGLSPDEADALHRAALELLAKLDLAAAEPAALRLVASDVPMALRWGAAAALAGSKSDAAVAALLDALAEKGAGSTARGFGFAAPLRRAAEHALALTGRADVGDRVLAMLTDDALAIRAGATGDYVYANDREKDKQDFVRGILHVLGRLKHRPAWDRVAGVLRSHPLWEVRLMAAEALAYMARPDEIRGAFGEEPEAFFKKYVGVLGVFDRVKGEAVGKKLLAWVKKNDKKG